MCYFHITYIYIGYVKITHSLFPFVHIIYIYIYIVRDIFLCSIKLFSDESFYGHVY